MDRPTTERTFSMFSPLASRGMQARLPIERPEPANRRQGVSQALTEKYRPKILDEIVGQGYAVMRAQAFVECPHPAAFILSGETGTGKTSLAFAMANELGIDRDWGFQHIKSGEMDAEEVRRALDQLRFACPCGTGWKMIVADEADLMSNKSKGLWLSALESIPPKSVIIFTTNEPDKFPRRFLDRCEHIEFESRASVVMQDAQILLNRIWSEEGLRGSPPNVRDLREIVDGNTMTGKVSFRRVVRAVETEARKQAAGQGMASVAASTAGYVKAAASVVKTTVQASRPVMTTGQFQAVKASVVL